MRTEIGSTGPPRLEMRKARLGTALRCQIIDGQIDESISVTILNSSALVKTPDVPLGSRPSKKRSLRNFGECCESRPLKGEHHEHRHVQGSGMY